MFINNFEIDILLRRIIRDLNKDYIKIHKKLLKYGKKYNKCFLISDYYAKMCVIVVRKYYGNRNYSAVLSEMNNNSIDELELMRKSSIDLVSELQIYLTEMINVLEDVKRNPSNYIISEDEFINNKNDLNTYFNELKNGRVK